MRLSVPDDKMKEMCIRDRDDCMDVGWNEARMDEGVTDGHSHNSYRSDTHEERCV